MSDKLKKLTGKNQNEFESVAYELVNTPDIDLFKELVDSEDFLFDFVKRNVAQRISKACSKNNYLNLLKFFKFYSPSYEETLVSVLVKFADDDLTNKILEIFENGTAEEKTYCAKYFYYVDCSAAIDLLKKYAYSENYMLSANCASALSRCNNTEIYDDAINKLQSDDEFDQLRAVKFLVSYANKNAVPKIIKTIKKSSFAENMAAELPYLCDLFELIKKNRKDGLYILNLIISGLGETIDLSQLYDFNIYSIIEYLINSNNDSMASVVLLNACEKFSTLTENNEYLYDESKEVKEDVYAINELLESVPYECEELVDGELVEDSIFVFNALDFTTNDSKVRTLLSSSNQTLVLKSVEILKELKKLTPNDRNKALSSITDENIKNIIMAM